MIGVRRLHMLFILSSLQSPFAVAVRFAQSLPQSLLWAIGFRRHEKEQPHGNYRRYAGYPRKEMSLLCPLPKRRNPFLVNCIHLLVQPSHEVLFATHLWMVGMEYVVKFQVFHSSSFNLLTFPLNVIFLSTGLL